MVNPDTSRVGLKIPKKVLIDMAEKGLVEFGFFSGYGNPMETVILQSAWPSLMNYVVETVESQQKEK